LNFVKLIYLDNRVDWTPWVWFI